MRVLKSINQLNSNLNLKVIITLMYVLLSHHTYGDTLNVKFGYELSAKKCLREATFTDSTTYDDSTTIVEWFWDFGDGSGSSGIQNPTHMYGSPGDKVVTLQVITANGDTAVGSDTIIIPGLQGKFEFTAFPDKDTARVCLGVPVMVKNTSEGRAYDPEFIMYWDDGWALSFEDRNLEFSHIFTTPGIFHLSLKIQDDIVGLAGRCTHFFPDSSSPMVVEVLDVPKSDFSIEPEPGLVGMPILFRSTIDSIYDTQIWNFGDGVSDTIDNTENEVSHSYSQLGQKTVQLISQYKSNKAELTCKDTITKTLMIVDDLSGSIAPIKKYLTINPNPASESFRIKGDKSSIFSIELYNNTGSLVEELSPERRTYSIHGLSAGIYYLKVVSLNSIVYYQLKVNHN